MGKNSSFREKAFRPEALVMGVAIVTPLQGREETCNHTRSCVNLCCFYWRLTLFLPGIVKFLCSHRSVLGYVLTKGDCLTVRSLSGPTE